MDKFILKSKFKPITEQNDAIDQLTQGITDVTLMNWPHRHIAD